MWAGIAVAVPFLLAYNLPPSSTYFNQMAAIVGWGGWAMYASSFGPRKVWQWRHRLHPALAFLALLVVGSICSSLLWKLPLPLALSNAALLIAAALVALSSAPPGAGDRRGAFSTFCLALVLAGFVSCTIGVLQVLAPNLVGSTWIASSATDGRAVGNLRQSNHLCSQLLWAIVAIVWLQHGRTRAMAVWAAAVWVMLFVVGLTGSRSGIIGVTILAVWGLLDTRLKAPWRMVLLLSPIGYGLSWSAMVVWSHFTQHAIGAAGRFTTAGDISSSRFAIWSNTLDLIRAHPWFGVGFGEFNFAWTLTEFPNRPTAFFDHTHNLPLQFAVELGLPIAAVLLSLLGWGLWRAWRNCLRPPEADAGPAPQRAAFVMLVLILVHSLLEYPLWYAYFLLPTAFLFGLCLATPGATVAASALAPRRWGAHQILRVGAVLMMLGALYSVHDYLRVAVIFAPPANAAPLEERISAGQRSLFFSHHADYAAATTSDDPAVALPAAQRAAHYLLDTRLMMAWANTLHASGDSERAKYLAQRLVEFRNPLSEPFFAPCHDASLSDAQRPYQCFAPQRKFTFKDFR
jgi:O-antigen ligase